MLFFVRIWQRALWYFFLNNHKTETDREPRLLLKNLPKPTVNLKMETITALKVGQQVFSETLVNLL